jgi:hypothetical protein
MLGGCGSVLVLYVLGWQGVGKTGAAGLAAEPFAPLYLLGLDPLLWGLAASFGLGIGISLATAPMPAEVVDPYFLEGPVKEGDAALQHVRLP